MCGSMVDIQSATAEIRRGKKKEETTEQKYNGLSYSIGWPYLYALCVMHYFLEAVSKCCHMFTSSLAIEISSVTLYVKCDLCLLEPGCGLGLGL